ncbi:L-aspartate oxidase [Microbacterium thalassium]|uniref:L-aspartate oxidase n=1 Tax=Microbacterium thalassium TaxID=362649 RepID=A0A7X0KVM2_9MICO|nr:L-aspartate oxidase [Microbacterium thalassium]MBB6392343.1 L-aspartate oxidase [Microbacterium thalassium]GLK23553.1 L-aspartate oxidase [Microbacterium thalassium]
MTTPHVVVVGSGIAGLTVALHAVEHGCTATLVTKDVLEHANTRYAQGGIAGVMFDDDRAEDHVRDTMTAGVGLNDPDAVRVLVEEGPDRIRELVALGVAFDRGDDGAFVKGLEAAHSYPRILHAGGDATGTVIEKALVARLRASRVEVIEHAFLIDLVRDDGRVRGVDLLVGERDETDAAPAVTGHRRRIEADAVVLATGGAGELYAHSTNPAVATGDGIAAALRAGAAVADLEFFQFHPTILAVGEAFLVSEAVRGEGAVLRDDSGHRFALDAHPDGELAPRDVVARAIATAMDRQGGRPVVLDATGLHSDDADERAAFLARRFPTIDRAVRERGLDWAREPIPVTPAAHYLMGGVVTDLDGRTSVPGLYAVGEVARTGVHGANRLASNSLLEGAVFGARAGDAIAADIASGAWPAVSHFVSPAPAPAAGEPAGRDGAQPFSRRALQELLWEDAGLVRDEAGLAHAADVIARWRAESRAPRSERMYEDENLLLVAERLVAAARARRQSAGAHFRSDAADLAQRIPAADAVSAGAGDHAHGSPWASAHEPQRLGGIAC